MRTTRLLSTLAAVVAAALAVAGGGALAAAGDTKPGGDKERQLLGVLQSADSPPATKAITCKQLAVYGTKDAVPALAALLSDKDLASWARIALEAIPDGAVDDALRQALGTLQGRLLIGAINSLGVRRDAKALEALAARLKDADAEVASAAASALGRIGGEPAAKVLEASLAGVPAGVRPAVAEGCLLCAERFLADGKADQAVRLYDLIRKTDVPEPSFLEATRGAILARGPAGVPLLVAQLKSADKALFGIGLRVARELPGPEATEALTAELGKAAPERQAFILLALADRGDAKALPAVFQAAKSGQADVRMAAMGVLERLGNASCVPVLLDAAGGDDADLAKTARTALGRLSGQDVDAEILARLAKASGKVRQVLIEVAGLRRIEAAMPAMMRGTEDADPTVRAAAVAAIGAMGGQKQLADLLRILQKTQDAREQAEIEKALMAVSVRGGAACVAPLMPLVRSDSAALRVIGLHALACAGGSEALAAVKAALDDKDESVQDEAARTLSTWPNNWPDDAAVLEPLMALAKSSKKVTHQVLALRGYLQFVQGAKKLREEERLAKVKEVLPLASRAEEKRLAISVLGNIRAGGALETLAALAADSTVSEDACSAIVNLAGARAPRGIPRELRQKALQTAVEKARNAGLKKRAEDALKAIN